MLTAMTQEDWSIVLRVFAASRSRRGDKGRNDRKFFKALHYFVVPPQQASIAGMQAESFAAVVTMVLRWHTAPQNDRFG